jgi:hypothetical protein
MAGKEMNGISSRKGDPMAVEIMQRTEDMIGPDKETLYMLGGLALVLFGAGLVLSNPSVRRYLGQIGLGNFASAALPDLERYFRLRSM